MRDCFAGKPEVAEGREIHAHERQQRAEGDYFRGVFPRDGNHAEVGEDANDPHVVNGIAFPGAEVAEDLSRQHIVTTHAVEQARRADVSGKPAGDAGNDKHDAVRSEQRVWPDYTTLQNPETAFMDVARMASGPALYEINLQ